MFIPHSRKQIQYIDQLFAQSDQLTENISLKGNKIILPQSSITQISGYIQQNHNGSPLIFCISNQLKTKYTFVSVLEFTAEEGTCIIPYWLFEYLELYINPQVNIAFNTQLPKASYLKFQPHKTLFIEQDYHPKALLDQALRNYLCLHIGDTIEVEDFNKNIFKLDILEIKPANQYNAAILLDADIDFDLAEPLDYNEKKQLNINQQSSSINAGKEEQKQQENNQQQVFFTGKGIAIDETLKTQQFEQQQQKQESQQEYDPRKFKLAHGVGKGSKKY